MNALSNTKSYEVTFAEVRIGENFTRADGVNGGSYDKTSAAKAKLCTLARNMTPQAMRADLPVFVRR